MIDLTIQDDITEIENTNEVIDITNSDEDKVSETDIDSKNLLKKKIFLCPICDVKAFDMSKIQDHLIE